VKTDRFVLSRHSLGISLFEIALSVWMSACSFVDSPRFAFALTGNVASPAFAPFQSSLITSRKMSASGAPINVAFPPLPSYLFTVSRSAWLSHK